jgi:hypothetical protein
MTHNNQPLHNSQYNTKPSNKHWFLIWQLSVLTDSAMHWQRWSPIHTKEMTLRRVLNLSQPKSFNHTTNTKINKWQLLNSNQRYRGSCLPRLSKRKSPDVTGNCNSGRLKNTRWVSVEIIWIQKSITRLQYQFEGGVESGEVSGASGDDIRSQKWLIEQLNSLQFQNWSVGNGQAEGILWWDVTGDIVLSWSEGVLEESWNSWDE